ncbi:MAG: WXG100 family type VII secretion target [Hamadaea sp.]|uniref:WXG100 family type VII secretion target n=1 Tax=Hamadaea sp. TaxID=2024425 RepID=UPI00184C5C5C|nr:WXG100 family type VII secretion target [Hamadaea sp.]NUR73284.1 WXG100 family type VII secretion target [Hamadaea sp.]NUT19394.1 WXG100 family type VII secretion target [Hamadaea sp.]
MSQTAAQTAFMETTASKFEATNNELQSMLRTLMGNLEILQKGWQGAGGRSFQQVKEQWNQDQAKLQQALLETASAIRDSGKSYANTDSESSSRMNNVNRGGINLSL